MGDGMHFPVSTETMAAVRAAQVAAGMYDAASMMDMSAVDAMSLHSPSGKKERKRGSRNKIGPSQLSNPSRPRLQELRNLPQRGLGLRWVSDDRKFQVVKLQQSTISGSPGPAATVVRPDPDGVLEATGGSNLPSLDDVKGSVVCWTVENWQALRYEASPETKMWTETESVPLDKNESGNQEEWARRFSQREKQWRILLHAFSPRDSEDEGDDPNDADGIREEVPNPQELMEELSLRVDFGDLVSTKIPPTPPKPSLQMSPSKTDGKDDKMPGTPNSRQSALRKSPVKSPVGSSAAPSPAPRTQSSVVSPSIRAPPATPARPPNLIEEGSPTALSNAATPLAVPPAFPFPNFADNFADALLPEFEEMLKKMGNIESDNFVNDLHKVLLSEFPGVAGDLDNSAQDLLPTGLLDTQQAELPSVDLEATLDRAQVPDELKPIFKEAFGNVHFAFSKPHDEREVILATAD